jgi:ankyrin repeat protein
MLAENAKNIHQSNYRGFNALLTAANRNHWDIVNIILKHQNLIADPLSPLPLNHTNSFGYTLAHYAAKYGRLDMLTLFQAEGADLNLKALDGHTPLSLARNSNEAESATYLVNCGYTVELEQQEEIQNLDGLALLSLAVIKNKNDLIKQILNQKTDEINQISSFGFTPLQYAASYGHWDIVNIILEHGKSVGNPLTFLQLDHKNNYGYTFAHYAAQYGKIEILRYLQTVGANLNIEANDGYTPLALAIYYNHHNIVHEIFSVHDKIEGETASKKSENSENTGTMLQSLTTHFLETRPGSKTRFIDILNVDENNSTENEPSESPTHQKNKLT